MNKDIETLIHKRVKNILNKDTLNDEDLKFLLLYRQMNKPNLLDTLKKIINFINSDDKESE